jgi:hypothetical protein
MGMLIMRHLRHLEKDGVVVDVLLQGSSILRKIKNVRW